MYTSDEYTDFSDNDGDICGDYDGSEPIHKWTMGDIDEELPVWWIRAEDRTLLA